VSHADLYVCHAVVCYIYDSSIRDTRHRDPPAAFLKHSFMAIGYTGFSYNDSVNDLWFFNFGSLYISNLWAVELDRKSTRLNSSHVSISYAVFCLKKKTNE